MTTGTNSKLTRRFQPAFTLIELIIVLIVLSLLAGLISFSAVAIQKRSRDVTRDANVRIIAASLEQYYRKNSEYPSVALMTSQDVGTIKQKLRLVSSGVLKFPLAPEGTMNSIVADTPSTTRLLYSASTTDTTKNTQCQGDANGYCDAFQLQYVKESDGSTVTVDSLHNKFVPIADAPTPQGPISYSDDFIGTGALGTVKTGTPTLTWQFFNSTSTNWSRNSGGYASSSVAASSNPMAVADVGRADVAITEGVRTTGNAIYFRVVDGSNWLRARVNETQTTGGYYQSYTTNYYRHQQYVAVYSESPCTGIYGYTDPVGSPYVDTSSSNPAAYCSGTNYYYYETTFDHSTSGQYWVSTTDYNYYLILEKSVAGTVTQLGSVSLGSSQPNYIKVVAKGVSLQTFYGSTSSVSSAGTSVTDTTNQTATKHGIGYASSSYGSPTGVKSIAIIDAP